MYRKASFHVRLAAALHAHRHLLGPLVICRRDGSPLTQRVVQGYVRRASRRAALLQGGRAHPSPHVLLAPRDAWCASAGDTGTGRTSGSLDHPAVHAPQSSSDRGGDSVAGSGHTG